MLELKEIQDVDRKISYDCFASFDKDTNGFINDAYGIAFEDYDMFVERCVLDSKGMDMPAWKVPSTVYLLMDHEKAVGIFKVRPNLNDALRAGAGHIGYGIVDKYRNMGYATKGLALAIEEVKKKTSEKEIYLSVNKDNLASLAVQKKNGAYLHHEDENKYYTRIKFSL